MRRERNGFALLEVLAVLGVMGVVALGAAATLNLALREAPAQALQNDGKLKVHQQLQRFRREMRLATNVAVPASDQMTFQDRAGRSISYQFSGGVLQRTEGGVTRTLLDGLGAVRFQPTVETIQEGFLQTTTTITDKVVAAWDWWPAGASGFSDSWYNVTEKNWAGSYFVLSNISGGSVVLLSMTLPIERRGSDDAVVEVFQTLGYDDPRPTGPPVASAMIPFSALPSPVAPLTITFTTSSPLRAGSPHMFRFRSADDDGTCRFRIYKASTPGSDPGTFATWSSNSGSSWSVHSPAKGKQVKFSLLARETLTSSTPQTRNTSLVTAVQATVTGGDGDVLAALAPKKASLKVRKAKVAAR